MLEIKTNESEAAAKIIVVGVGGGGNNVREQDRRLVRKLQRKVPKRLQQH